MKGLHSENFRPTPFDFGRPCFDTVGFFISGEMRRLTNDTGR